MSARSNNKSKLSPSKTRQVGYFVDEISNLRHQNALQKSQIKLLEIQLESQRHPGILARQLFLAVDERIMKMINKYGYKISGQYRNRAHSYVIGNSDSSAQDLTTEIYRYDVSTFFKYRAPRKKLKLHYRVGAKIYRESRDLFIKTARVIYNLKNRAEA